MESSSIVSFHNDSTFQSTLKGDFNNVSVHELALHAMRDRCLLLQKRINALESDNMRLKLDITKSTDTSYTPLRDEEKMTLHNKIAELNKQKSQLLHHVFMVSCENKNLWNKISTLKHSENKNEFTKQTLVRASAHVNSTPKSSANYQEKFSESSLEEISLKLINSYIQEKSQLVEQYEQMAELQGVDDEHLLNVNSLGFTYMEDPVMDSLKEIQIHTEKLHILKEELAKQEEDLKVILERVETVLKDGYKCPGCIANSRKIIPSEHKEIETSDSLTNWATPVESNNYNNLSDVNTSIYRNNSKENNEVQIKERLGLEKVCPMCGQNFPKDVIFTDFQSHVESHFVGESEIDSVIDNVENAPYSFDGVI